jgi:arylsulfatase A-like enzyme
VEGLDLTEFVCGNDDAAPASEYINFPCMPSWFRDPEWRGVVTRTHTYIETKEGPWLLYDDATDPFQLQNLVDDAAEQQTVNELHALTQDWLAQTNDPFETSEQIADRLCPGHVNCVLPNPPLEEVIRLGQRERMLQRAKRSIT